MIAPVPGTSAADAARTRGIVFPRTKFHRPPARPEHVPRHGLLERIDRSGASMLRVSAPAGYGKSTLLAQWVATRPDPERTAWVSVDRDDRDGRLWAALLAALHPLVGDPLDELLRAASIPDADLRDDVLVGLLDRLTELDDPVTIVLDDLHLVLDDPATRQSVDWVLERIPAPHAVGVGARRTPALEALSRRGIRGELFDVRTEDLRFGTDEAAQFVRERLGLTVSDGALAALQARVEGWPAALYLAALRLRIGEPVDHVTRDVATGDDAAFGALADEVLAVWPASHRRFLHDVALLDRFTADLCVRSLDGDEDEIREAFREFTGSSLLVIPLDRQRTWFRCHHLLRDVLRERLEASDPVRARRLHVRAGAWLESEGGESELYEALDHYLAAGAWDPAAELLAAHSMRLVGLDAASPRSGRWLERFPADLVRRDARLAFVAALTAAVAGDRAGRDSWLAAGAEAGWDGPMPDGTATFSLAADVLSALVCFGDLGSAAETGARVLEQLPRAAPAALAVAAFTAWHELLRGHHELAVAWAERALEGQRMLPASAGLPLVPSLASAVLALVAFDRGATDAGTVHLEAAEQALRAGPPRIGPHALPVVCARIRGALVRGRGDDAINLGRTGLRQAAGGRDSSLMVPAALVELARACAAVGDHDERDRAVGEARARLADAPDPGVLRSDLAALTDGTRPRGGDDAELSERELDVLRALAGTGSLRDVADGLRISHNTVKTHARTLYAKLGVGSRRDAVGQGRALGLLGDAYRRSPDEEPIDAAQ